jgi:hypothetical protein
MLPTFLIIGSMKSGTTSLYHYLRAHPDIFMPRNKEPKFFSHDPVWAKGVKWYESLFQDGRGKKAAGEASVGYTKYPYYCNVPQRIASLVPSMKLLYVLRSPVDRIYSHYLHNIYAGLETDPFETAVLTKPLYVQTSLYYNQIEQYLHYFPRQQLSVLRLEELQQRPVETVKGIFEFLGVDAGFIPPNLHEIKHQSKLKRGRDTALAKLFRKMPFYHYLADTVPEHLKTSSARLLKKKLENPRPITDAMYNTLLDQLSGDLEKLEQFLNTDLGTWKRRRGGTAEEPVCGQTQETIY